VTEIKILKTICDTYCEHKGYAGNVSEGDIGIVLKALEIFDRMVKMEKEDAND